MLGLLKIIGGALGRVAGVAGGHQAGENNARVKQGELDISRDRNVLDRYGLQQRAQFDAGNLDLDRKGFETSNRSATSKQALIGALLGGGIAPTSFKGGQASGGMFRALQSNPDALAAMKTLGSQGAEAQATPLQFTGGEVLDAPGLSNPQKLDIKGSKWMKILQMIGAAADFNNEQTPPPLPSRDLRNWGGPQ